jgi:hypothetical protein
VLHSNSCADEVQEKAKVIPRSRACVGAETLLACERSKLDLVAHAQAQVMDLDVGKELENFYFDEQQALITRSQLEENDLTLPLRFIKVTTPAPIPGS